MQVGARSWGLSEWLEESLWPLRFCRLMSMLLLVLVSTCFTQVYLTGLLQTRGGSDGVR